MSQDLLHQISQISPEFITLTATATPWVLQKAGESVIGEVVKERWRWLQGVFRKENKQQELDKFIESPEDPKVQGRLELVLEEYLKNHPQEIAELKKLLPELKEDVKKINIQTVKDNATGYQDSTVINIGK